MIRFRGYFGNKRATPAAVTGTGTLAADVVAIASTTGISASIGIGIAEEQRTNLALWSGDIGNAVWAGFVNGSGTSSRTSNVGAAPDGTTTAGLVTVNRPIPTDWAQGPAQSFTGTGGAHTGSIWLKAYQVGDVGRQINICLYDTNVVGIIAVTLTANWVRYITSGALSAGTCQFITGYCSSGAGGVTTVGQTQYLAWGGQVELGATVSSYIPTTTVAVTRAATYGVAAAIAAVTGSGFAGTACLGSGTPAAAAAVVASTTGVSRSVAPSVALAAQAAAAASTTGLSRSIAPPVALAAQQSVISGLGGAGTTLVGTGVVTTRPALVAGVGGTASAGIGALQVSVATIDAHGVSAWIATAANLNVAWADIDGLGEIPINTVVSGPYAQVGDLWEGAAVWGKVAGKWRRLRLWTKAADAWGIAAWDQATQEVDVWSLPAYGELDARGAHIAGSGFIRDQIWGAGDLVASPALVTDASSLSGLSVITHAAWEPTPAWVKVNGKWRRATMWTNVSEEWKRVA